MSLYRNFKQLKISIYYQLAGVLSLAANGGGIKCWGFRGGFIFNRYEANLRELHFANHFNPNIL
jgi:hypothetical protein